MALLLLLPALLLLIATTTATATAAAAAATTATTSTDCRLLVVRERFPYEDPIQESEDRRGARDDCCRLHQVATRVRDEQTLFGVMFMFVCVISFCSRHDLELAVRRLPKVK